MLSFSVKMKPSRLFVVLTWLFSFGGALGFGFLSYIMDEFCDTIRDQLGKIGSRITEMEVHPTTTHSASYRLELLLQNYDQTIARENACDEVHNFVHAKLKELGIPVVGLQDDVSKLVKIFQHIDKRNQETEHNLSEEQTKLRNLEMEIKNQQSVLDGEKKRKREFQIKLEEINKMTHNG